MSVSRKNSHDEADTTEKGKMSLYGRKARVPRPHNNVWIGASRKRRSRRRRRK
jgi:hypothetical protein